jgi:regulation of enolase protein 1 (concanavalin A-like superfamily)
MWQKVISGVAVVLVLGLAQITMAGQLGYWAFDEGSGTTVKDSSGKGNAGTLMGGATWADGKFGKAVKLDGVDDYVQVAHNANLCVTGEVTVSVWVYAERTDGPAASGYQGIVAKGNAPRSYSLYTTAAGPLHFSTGPSGAYIGTTSSTPLPTKQWVHVAVKVEGGQHKYFINGVAAGVGGAGTVLPGAGDTSPVVIGRTAEGASRSFQGMIDDVRIYDLALTDQQILDLFNNKPPVWPKAINPTPANGAQGVSSPLFQWTPGDGALFHDVYVGTTPELAEADKAGMHLPFTMYYHVAGLQAGTTYYWRVDETAADGTIATGDVWSFKVTPATAWIPGPPDGAAYIKTSSTLTWTPGQSALNHDVYVSTSREEVEKGDAAAFKGNQKTASLQLDGLTSDTTYYWRVDEVAMTGTKVSGEIWKFTTRPVIAKADPTLVGWWKLENEGAGVAVDYSGYDRDGTLMGNPQWVDGYLAGALKFNGTTEYVETNYTENLAKWTICCWVTSPAAPAATSPTGPLHREKNYQFDWGHTNAVYQGAAAMCIGGTWYAAKFGPLSGNTWYHLAASFDGTAMKAYLNGTLITTTPAVGVPDAEVGTLKLGRHSTAAQFFNGTVDDARVYNRALTVEEIQKAMQGDPLVASNPQPANNVNVDIQNATELAWAAGEKAAKHDVYFGKDLAAVKTASTSAPEYQGRQTGTSFALAGLVEFGGGAYAWRIDEVEADDTTVHRGNVWTFTIPAYLIVDEFESYTDAEGSRIYETWVDGWTNGTGSTAGNTTAPFAERTIVHSGMQALPMDFNNTKTPFYSEVEQTFSPLRNWTENDVTDLSLWFQGNPARFVDKGNGAFTVGASGHDIWDNADDFRFVYKQLNGNGSVTVKVESLVNTNAWAKAGVMIRESLDGGSTMAYMIQSFSSGASFGWRQVADGTCGSQTQTGVNAPQWVKLTRTGNAFTAQYSADGKTWTDIKDATTGQVVSTTVGMGANIYIGLCVTSHNSNATTTAEFSGAATTGGVTGSWQQTWIGDDPDRTNGAGDVYVAVEDSTGKVAVASDPTLANAGVWTEWKIPLSGLTGVNLAKVKKLYIGVGDRDNPSAGSAGRLYIDDIRLTKP